MTGCGTVSLTVPDNCRVNMPGASINLVVTGPGDFKAHLTWVKLRRLRLIRCRENVPHIAFVRLAQGQVFVTFPTHHDPAPIWSGAKMRSGGIVLHSLGERIHRQTSGESRWGFISLAPDHLAAHSRALSGVDLIIPVAARILRPPPVATTYLLRLHAKACRLAETKPDMIAHREVARALEQDLLYALVNCLTADDTQEDAAASRRHAEIMARFEDVLASHDDRQLSMTKICAAIDVRERTLRMCCAEFLGLSPGTYVRLRRLNLVRAALRQADPATTSIATVARRYGFSELGRFAVVYRRVFGETPSVTLDGHSKIRDAALPNSHRQQDRAAPEMIRRGHAAPARSSAVKGSAADRLGRPTMSKRTQRRK
jgi:AraC-like DNA-binding protein